MNRQVIEWLLLTSALSLLGSITSIVTTADASPSIYASSLELLPPIAGNLEYPPCSYPGDKDPNNHLFVQSAAAAVGSRGRIAGQDSTGRNYSVMHEYCPDAIVNGISKQCREYWMRKTIDIPTSEAAQSANHQCPESFFSALVVDHSDGSRSNHVIDGSNCGSMTGRSGGSIKTSPMNANSAVMDVIKEVRERFSNQGLRREFWNKLTIYLPAEPTPLATELIADMGIREIVYSRRLGDLIEVGYPLLAETALNVLRKQSPKQLLGTGVIMGQVLQAQTKEYYGWQFASGNDFKCPGICERYPDNGRGARCRAS